MGVERVKTMLKDKDKKATIMPTRIFLLNHEGTPSK
jgi:hypothetical protein